MKLSRVKHDKNCIFPNIRKSTQELKNIKVIINYDLLRYINFTEIT